MGASITFTGGAALRGQLTGLAAQASQAVAKALYQEGQTIITESRERVPVDTGALKNSAFTTTPEREGNTTRVTVGYGGAAAEYALIVHEDLEVRHTVGGPKYLESVINEHAPGFADRIGAQVKGDLGL